MDDQVNEGVPANVDNGGANAGTADANAPQAVVAVSETRLPEGAVMGEVAPTHSDDNLARAYANGYRDPEPIHPVDRVKAVLASMEHQIKHNGPITLEMIRELRDVLNLPAEPETAPDAA